MVAQTQSYSAEEFDVLIDLPENAERFLEYIGGEIVEVPSNPYTSFIGGWILTFINIFLLKNPIGYATGEAGLYRVMSERYAPDVGYISKARQAQLVRQGINPNAPDLAVEVVSPSDSLQKLMIKVSNYLAAGTVVWVVYPTDRQVVVHAPGQSVQIFDIEGILSGGNILPGFELPVKDIFRDQ
ncbi:MAG: Uma2 family endonuclease [Burkholderiales bacterium]|nr:Uma2 family endonuclease [Anaerolineae bacterium]